MIPNQWYAVLESDEVRAGQPVGVTRLGEKLVFWRTPDGQVACLRDLCCHRGAALSLGKVHADGTVACPFHGLRYDASGRCRLIPANGKAALVPEQFRVAGYPAREAHGFIWVWWGVPREGLPELPWFDDLGDDFTYATYRDHWAAHYSRAIENQLDVAHLPFVHHNTIGRGNKTLVNGPKIEVRADGENLWVYNSVDDGTTPLKPEQIPDPKTPAMLHFRFANIWQNRIADDIRVMVAFAPIDEGNSLLYLRFYQRVVRVPLLRELFAWLGKYGNRTIAHQDRRVVITQQPKPSSLTGGEKLFQADRPIVEYRRMRQALIEAAQGKA